MRSRVLVIAIALIALCAPAIAQAPQITQGPRVEHVDSTTAVIAWSTNVNTGTMVRYGTNPNDLIGTATMPWGGITHRVTLKNLDPNTTYYFKAISGQAQGSGGEAISAMVQFQTTGQSTASSGESSTTTPSTLTPTAPTTPVVPTTQQGSPATRTIASEQPSAVEVAVGPIPQHLTDKSASIWWETAQPVALSLRYGTSPTAMNHTAPETGGGSQRSHRVDLNGLQPGTTYFLALVDSTGKQAGAGQFTTYATNYSKDKTVDITNGPVIEYLSDRQAVIAWSTDQKSSTVVKYGTDPSSLNLTAEAAWSAGNATHRVTLNNLQPNTKYWFQIESAQTQGTNPAAHSPEYPFQTVQNASAALRFTPPQH